MTESGTTEILGSWVMLDNESGTYILMEVHCVVVICHFGMEGIRMDLPKLKLGQTLFPFLQAELKNVIFTITVAEL